ncbi:hypothetical protein TNCV_28271 [Trichonephila clavipes]|uniref:Uncharacterized protein n=1 Tax=Trichonephila clavipes TaxID=2585209 RepID=A0A8X6WK79_TRICX|nr:hypothetical protein TNCV_28271 [Trichonephila clavipes]
MNMNCYKIAKWQISTSSTTQLTEMDVLMFGCMGKDPTRRQTNHQTFARVHQNLAKHGSFRAMTDDNSEMNLVHEYLSLLLRSVKRLVFSYMSANSCSADVVHVYVPIAAIADTSWGSLMLYF